MIEDDITNTHGKALAINKVNLSRHIIIDKTVLSLTERCFFGIKVNRTDL